MNIVRNFSRRAVRPILIAGTALFLAAGVPKVSFAQDSAKAKPPPLLPINFASHTRLSPNAWVGKDQFVYAMKANGNSAPTHIRMLWFGDGQSQGGIMMVKNPNGSEVFGVAGRRMADAFGGRIGGCARIAVQRQGATSTPLAEISMNAERIAGAPVSIIVAGGNSENYVSGHYSNSHIGISGTYRNNRKDGASAAFGGDFDFALGDGMTDRVFVSFMHSFATKSGVFGAGTRITMEMGNAEIVCWTDGSVLGRLAINF